MTRIKPTRRPAAAPRPVSYRPYPTSPIHLSTPSDALISLSPLRHENALASDQPAKNNGHRVVMAARVSNSCVRCRSRNQRCSRTNPCEPCAKAGVFCDWTGGHCPGGRLQDDLAIRIHRLATHPVLSAPAPSSAPLSYDPPYEPFVPVPTAPPHHGAVQCIRTRERCGSSVAGGSLGLVSRGYDTPPTAPPPAPAPGRPRPHLVSNLPSPHAGPSTSRGETPRRNTVAAAPIGSSSTSQPMQYRVFRSDGTAGLPAQDLFPAQPFGFAPAPSSFVGSPFSAPRSGAMQFEERTLPSGIGQQYAPPQISEAEMQQFLRGLPLDDPSYFANLPTDDNSQPEAGPSNRPPRWPSSSSRGRGY